ncbi:MAG: pirin family protein [Kordiimonas sp.]
MAQQLLQERKIKTLFTAEAMPEGQGVTVHRSIGRRGLMNLDPFLLLDEMDISASAKGAGFPDHPHRGFETVTYMLSGQITHKDSEGNEGTIGPGDVQWMTAGHGVVHSELPVSEGEAIRGFQLWVNLPAAKKMIDPRYQDITSDNVPTVVGDGYKAQLIAGTLNGISGPVTEISVHPLYVDVTLTENGSVKLPIPSGHTAFLYGIDSDLLIADQNVVERTLVILGEGDHVQVSGHKGDRFLLVAGAPIGEPVARYGPFVMNTTNEIKATIDDWNNGRLLKTA